MRLPLILLFALLGCSQTPIRHIAQSPSVSVVADRVEMSGDTKVQPNVNTKKSDGRMTIPEGSRIEFNERLGVMSLVLSKATDIAVNRSETAVKGPVAFTPDRGPTIGEEKEAQADFWTMIGLRAGVAAGIAVAVFGLVRQWDLVMYGGAAVAAACLFGIFIQKHPILLLVIGLGTAMAIVGPIIWHTKLKKKDGTG